MTLMSTPSKKMEILIDQLFPRIRTENDKRNERLNMDLLKNCHVTRDTELEILLDAKGHLGPRHKMTWLNFEANISDPSDKEFSPSPKMKINPLIKISSKIKSSSKGELKLQIYVHQFLSSSMRKQLSTGALQHQETRPSDNL